MYLLYLYLQYEYPRMYFIICVQAEVLILEVVQVTRRLKFPHSPLYHEIYYQMQIKGQVVIIEYGNVYLKKKLVASKFVLVL